MEDLQKKGLTSEEAASRQKEGRNVLSQGKKNSVAAVILSQFASPLILLLIAAAVISFVTGELADAIIIAVVVIANCIIGTVQEISAQKSVDALKNLTVSTAVVIRDGTEQEISSEELVPGDYVILEAGRVVPADLKLVGTSSLKVNESALTGESVAVEKDASQESDESTPLAERKDRAFMSWNTGGARESSRRSGTRLRSVRSPVCCRPSKKRRRRFRRTSTGYPWSLAWRGSYCAS